MLSLTLSRHRGGYSRSYDFFSRISDLYHIFDCNASNRKYDIRSANNNSNNFKYQDFILVEFIRIGSLLFGNLL